MLMQSDDLRATKARPWRYRSNASSDEASAQPCNYTTEHPNSLDHSATFSRPHGYHNMCWLICSGSYCHMLLTARAWVALLPHPPDRKQSEGATGCKLGTVLLMTPSPLPPTAHSRKGGLASIWHLRYSYPCQRYTYRLLPSYLANASNPQAKGTSPTIGCNFSHLADASTPKTKDTLQHLPHSCPCLRASPAYC